MSIVLFLIVLAVLIFAHELGHFIVAKKSGIRVDEFGFGFPPRIFKFQKGETIYSVNLIPFGGFVKIYGEEGRDTGDPRSFASKSVGVRAIVIAAGVIFNLILAWFLFSSGFLVGLPTSIGAAPKNAEIKNLRTVIIGVTDDSPAGAAGLKPGDELIGFSKAEEFQGFIEKNKGKEIEINYRRENRDYVAKLTPRHDPPAGQGAIGVAMDTIGIVKLPVYFAVWEGMKMTFQTTVGVALSFFYFIVDAIKGVVGFESIAGPVGIVSATGAVAKMGLSYLLSFVAFLSINLAVINIVPFPALDGGRLLFLFIEKIKGSPVNTKISGLVHGIGLVLLLLLMAAVTYHDILRLI